MARRQEFWWLGGWLVWLIAEETFQGVAGGILAGVGGFAGERAPGHLEPFAVIGAILFRDFLGAAVAALIRDGFVVVGAIQTDVEIGAAAFTGFHASDGPGEGPFPAALMAMLRHGGRLPEGRLEAQSQVGARIPA